MRHCQSTSQAHRWTAGLNKGLIVIGFMPGFVEAVPLSSPKAKMIDTDLLQDGNGGMGR
jgi:hypothetical protein